MGDGRCCWEADGGPAVAALTRRAGNGCAPLLRPVQGREVDWFGCVLVHTRRQGSCSAGDTLHAFGPWFFRASSCYARHPNPPHTHTHTHAPFPISTYPSTQAEKQLLQMVGSLVAGHDQCQVAHRRAAQKLALCMRELDAWEASAPAVAPKQVGLACLGQGQGLLVLVLGGEEGGMGGCPQTWCVGWMAKAI